MKKKAVNLGLTYSILAIKHSKHKTMESFSVLKPYTTRVFLSSSRQHIGELTQVLRQVYSAFTLNIETVTLTADDHEATYERLSLPNHPSIYLILLENPRVGPQQVKSVFDLVAYGGKAASAIIYIHASAMSNFKMSVLHNFPVVLFHNDDDFKAYFTSKRLGRDAEELVFVLAQKQDYVMKQTAFREDFATMKKEKSDKREKKPAKPRHVVQREANVKVEKSVPKKLEPLESPPQLKDSITTTSPSKKMSGFIEVTRKNLKSQPPAVENHKIATTKIAVVEAPKPIRISREPVVRKPWALPADVESSSTGVQTPTLLDYK